MKRNLQEQLRMFAKDNIKKNFNNYNINNAANSYVDVKLMMTLLKSQIHRY